MDVGEVELILSLQRSRMANAPATTDAAANEPIAAAKRPAAADEPIAPAPAKKAVKAAGGTKRVTTRRKAVTSKKKGAKGR